MLIRFAFFPLLLALGFSGCKKPATAATNNTAPNQSVAASATPGAASKSAAAAPTVAPVITKPAIDQNAQVVIFGYHRFVNNVRRPESLK